MLKKSLLILFFLVSSFSYAQIVPKRPVASEFSWRILQSAQVAFENNDYSSAINLANKAKENRKAESAWEFYVLDTALSPLAVRRAGTAFSDVLDVLHERDENEAISLIKKYLDLYGTERFKNSVTNMVSWVKEKDVYPEADFLIGKIYQIEGEYETAYQFFENARLAKNFLDIPDEMFDILFSMAELSRLLGKDEQYEQSLMLILSHDENFDNVVLKNAVFKIVDANKKENVDRFFNLFRADSVVTLEALHQIAKIYNEREEYNNALFAFALCSIESFTHIFDSLSERDTDFVYTSFTGFLEKVSRYDDILEWCEENHVWESMITFAQLCADRGCVDFANQFFLDMYKSVPGSYWQAEALNKIVKY